MEDWKENLLNKVNTVLSHKDKLYEEDLQIVIKLEFLLRNQITPTWRLHKKFTAIRVKLFNKLSGKDCLKKKKEVKYWISKE